MSVQTFISIVYYHKNYCICQSTQTPVEEAIIVIILLPVSTAPQRGQTEHFWRHTHFSKFVKRQELVPSGLPQLFRSCKSELEQGDQILANQMWTPYGCSVKASLCNVQLAVGADRCRSLFSRGNYPTQVLRKKKKKLVF